MSNKRKRGVWPHTPALPHLPDEVVFEILLKLPVKSLVRFKSVSKAWHAVISDPFFVRAQLKHSASRMECDPSFLISPHTLDRVIPGEMWPTTFSNQLRFYEWHQGGDSKATFVHGKDFGAEFGVVHDFAYCDGLVLAPTETKLYLFNPSTRDSFTLPNSSRHSSQQERRGCHSVAGLGLDPRTGNYKVVRSFFRLRDCHRKMCHVGMEVFTVGGGGGGWTEILPDPPYPVQMWQTAVTVKGFLFWHLDNKSYREQQQPPCGILRLSLEHELFSVNGLPGTLDPALHDSFILDELHGELALKVGSSESPPYETVTIWVMSVEASKDSEWEGAAVLHPCLGCLPSSVCSSST